MNQALLSRAIQRVMPTVRKSGLLASLATFQSSDAADFPDGFPSDDFQDLPGLVDLPCIAAPENLSSASAGETKTAADVTAIDMLQISFGTVYPALNAGW